jgi:cellulose synthase operon protein C
LQTTPQVVERDLELAPEEFDKQYLAWLDKKFGAEAAHFDEWRAKLKALVAAAEQKRYDAVLQQGSAIVTMYPEHVGEANAYELMADAYQAKGDAKAEAAVLTAYEQEGGQIPNVLKRLATLEEAAGHSDKATATLARINYIYPLKDEDLHRRLGDLLYAQKQYDAAIREYSALVALGPLDKAGAQFNLAQAYLAAGQKDKAEECVLAALETAPGYRPAQKLLLELQQLPAKTN